MGIQIMYNLLYSRATNVYVTTLCILVSDFYAVINTKMKLSSSDDAASVRRINSIRIAG